MVEATAKTLTLALRCSVIRGSEAPLELHSLPLLPTCGILPLAVPKIHHGYTPMNFDRCAISPSLHRPPDALRAQSPKQASLLCSQEQKNSNLSVTVFPMVEATGLEPAASCSQSRHSTKLSYASNCFAIIHVKLIIVKAFGVFLA